MDPKTSCRKREPLPASISVVIPAYNEEKRLPQTLQRVQAYLDSSERDWELIVVDDGSRDGTAALVAAAAAENPRIRLVSNPGNRGKGYAVRNGMLAAKGAWRLYSDADLSAPIEDLEKLEAHVQREDADIAIGSRAVDRSLVSVHQSKFREMSGRFFNRVMRKITGLPFSDTQCGFKLFRAEAAECVFQRQLLDGFSFDVEDLVIAKALGLKAVETPVRWANVEGTKVSLFNGLRSFQDLLQIRSHERAGRYQ